MWQAADRTRACLSDSRSSDLGPRIRNPVDNQRWVEGTMLTSLYSNEEHSAAESILGCNNNNMEDRMEGKSWDLFSDLIHDEKSFSEWDVY